MAVHLVLMNVAGPAIALAMARNDFLPSALRRRVLLAMTVQLALLWMWHAPPLLARVMEQQGLHLIMQASLLLAAVWFWSAILSLRRHDRWRSLLALLLTSKLFCLLGVLFVFAPRILYPEVTFSAHHGSATSLADQQLAGLLMLVVCPASYLTAGVIMAARWIFEIEASASEGANGQVEPAIVSAHGG